MSNGTNAGWFPDPLGRHEHRFWDGSAWTSHVADAGRAGEDPLGPPPPAHVVPSGPTWQAPHPDTSGTSGVATPPQPTRATRRGGARRRPPRAALIAALVVVALVLALGIVVGTRLASDDSASPDPTATEVLGAGTPASPVLGSLDLGASTEPTATPVGPDGATIDTPSGIEIDIPDGAHADQRTYTVTETEIVGHSFGELVRPASALLTVDNGGGAADVPVEVTFPVDRNDDEFAAAVFYDATTGRLELLPVVRSDEHELTVMTRHFSALFVTIVDIVLLRDRIIDSGFRPGVDSWQFVNEGSYIASNGHCSGQSLSALWYYVEQRLALGASPLFGRYDDRIAATAMAATRGFQADDRDGYRLASMVQDDEAKAYDAAERRWDDLTKARLGTLQYYAFAYAILLSGEPQYVGLYASAGGGHAMVIYGVTPDALLVSDPNYPTAYREIAYDADSGRLGPYESSLDATSPSLTFESIGYYGKTALVNWAGLGGRWQQFLDGTIGDARFPAMTLEVREEDDEGTSTWVALADRYEVDDDQTAIEVRLAGANAWDDRLRVYRWASLLVDGRSWNDTVEIPIEEGVNRLGVEAIGYDWSERQEGWVDFQRITVIRGETDEAPLDLVFVIDLTSSMEDDIAGVKAAATEIVRTVARTNEDWRIAIVGYRDVGDSPMFEDTEFAADADTVIAGIDGLTVFGGGDTPEAVYEALTRAIEADTIGGWRDGANKQTILMGDAPGHLPGSGGETPESVARAAELADPVVIQSVVVGNAGLIDPEAAAGFAELSELTAGQTFTAEDAAAVPAALQQSIGATEVPTPAVVGDDRTDWGRTAVLVVSLLLVVGGAGVVLVRLLGGDTPRRRDPDEVM
jgi:hypothetical protein